jgi:methyltransferase family protein
MGPGEFASASDFGPEVGYRRYVGPAGDYDLMSGLQFSVLYLLGLREHHRLLDIGCGSLRGGRLFIPYLEPGRYVGVEPNEWLIKEGIAENIGEGLVELKRPQFIIASDFAFEHAGLNFDFLLAQSILSHTYEDLTLHVLRKSREVMADGATFVGTFIWRRPMFGQWVKTPGGDASTGWTYPHVVAYTPRSMERVLQAADLTGRVLPLAHPRQTWFAAVRRSEAERLDELVHKARSALRAPTFLQLVKKRSKRLAYLQVKKLRSARAARAATPTQL